MTPTNLTECLQDIRHALEVLKALIGPGATMKQGEIVAKAEGALYRIRRAAEGEPMTVPGPGFKFEILRKTLRQLVADAINFGKSAPGSSQADHFQKMMVGLNDDIDSQLRGIEHPPAPTPVDGLGRAWNALADVMHILNGVTGSTPKDHSQIIKAHGLAEEAHGIIQRSFSNPPGAAPTTDPRLALEMAHEVIGDVVQGFVEGGIVDISDETFARLQAAFNELDAIPQKDRRATPTTEKGAQPPHAYWCRFLFDRMPCTCGAAPNPPEENHG